MLIIAVTGAIVTSALELGDLHGCIMGTRNPGGC